MHSSLALTIGGLALFMYGMTLASENLEKLASDRIRQLLQLVSKRPMLGVFVGAMLTVMIQSSGAVTTMLVGLGSASVITLTQVMSLILGSAVGSTITVQVISFNISQFGLPLLAGSFFVYFLSHRPVLQRSMQVLMGFGFLFWGLEIIGIGTEQLKHIEIFIGFLNQLKDQPLYALMFSAFFTAIVHSSAVTIGFAMSLMSSGIITGHEAVYWVFGANIGTTATALIAAGGGNHVGRQVAWAHCFYKLTTMFAFMPISSWFMDLISTGAPVRDIANFHTLYNIIGAVAFYPGIRLGARLVEKLFPPKESDLDFAVQFLDKTDWDSPSVFCAHAEREVYRMGDIVATMLHDSLEIFRRDDSELVKSIRVRDDRVDILNREINLYLARQLNRQPDQTNYLRMMKTLTFCTDLESCADVIDNQLLDLARKKHDLKVEFSSQGWKDLEEMHRAVVQVLGLSLSCFQTGDAEVAAKVIFHKRNIRKLEKRMREAHIQRIAEGLRDSITTSSIHMDVLGEYRRIAGLASNHAYPLVKDSDPYNLLPRREH